MTRKLCTRTYFDKKLKITDDALTMKRHIITVPIAGPDALPLKLLGERHTLLLMFDSWASAIRDFVDSFPQGDDAFPLSRVVAKSVTFTEIALAIPPSGDCVGGSISALRADILCRDGRAYSMVILEGIVYSTPENPFPKRPTEIYWWQAAGDGGSGPGQARAAGEPDLFR